MEALFGLDDDLDFCVLAGSDVKIQRCCFTAIDLEDALEKVCAQSGLGVVQSDGVYYVVSDSGMRERLVNGNKSWYKVKLEYSKGADFVSILKRRFGNLECIVLPDGIDIVRLVKEQQLD